MVGHSRLIQALRNKCAGRAYDVELYVNTMDRLMRNVFRVFSRSFSSGGGAEPDAESFMNLCWERLEEGRVVFKLSDLSFEDDTHLVRYTRKIFENLLRETAEACSPGFRARRKQVERVLKKRCLSTCRTMCRCWKLSEFRHKVCAPAEPHKLAEAALSLAAPEPRPSAHSASRAPSVKDEDMADYLTNLLRKVGGMARHQDVLSVITRRYNLYPVRVGPLPPEERETPFSDDDEWLLSPEHELMAEEIFGGMDAHMIDVHFYRVAREMTIAESARRAGCSTGTLYNREKAYKEYLRAYFQERGSFPATEEMEAVLRIVSVKVREIKGRK